MSAAAPVVLIVDDHALFRESVARMLEWEGIGEVLHCGNSAEALECLRTGPCNLILLDYDLRTETGTRVLDALDQLPDPPPVLLVTAGLSDMAVMELAEFDIAGVFLKDSRMVELVRLIREILEGGFGAREKLPGYARQN